MKKSITSIALVLGFASALFGFEWGGLVTNNTNALTSDFKHIGFNQSNGIHFNVSSGLSKDKSLRLAAEAMYKYDLVLDEGKTTFVNTADLSLLKLTGQWNLNGSILSMNAGRFDYSDKTGFVFAQKSDGLNLNFIGKDISAGFYAGYTGLVNRYTVNMTDNEKIKTVVGQFYDLSYPYIPIMLDFTLSNLSNNQVGLQAQYYLDVTTLRADKAYGSLYAKGAMGSIGSYYCAATLGTNSFKDIMLRANLSLSFFISDNFMVGAGADYASGYNKVFAEFMPITLKPIHFTVAGVDAVIPRVSASYATNNFIVSLTEKLVMTVPQNLSVDGLDSNLSLMYNIFSDLQVSSAITAYVDFISKDKNKFSVTLNANFAF